MQIAPFWSNIPWQIILCIILLTEKCWSDVRFCWVRCAKFNYPWFCYLLLGNDPRSVVPCSDGLFGTFWHWLVEILIRFVNLAACVRGWFVYFLTALILLVVSYLFHWRSVPRISAKLQYLTYFLCQWQDRATFTANVQKDRPFVFFDLAIDPFSMHSMFDVLFIRFFYLWHCFCLC